MCVALFLNMIIPFAFISILQTKYLKGKRSLLSFALFYSLLFPPLPFPKYRYRVLSQYIYIYLYKYKERELVKGYLLHKLYYNFLQKKKKIV